MKCINFLKLLRFIKSELLARKINNVYRSQSRDSKSY